MFYLYILSVCFVVNNVFFPRKISSDNFRALLQVLQMVPSVKPSMLAMAPNLVGKLGETWNRSNGFRGSTLRPLA